MRGDHVEPVAKSVDEYERGRRFIVFSHGLRRGTETLVPTTLEQTCLARWALRADTDVDAPIPTDAPEHVWDVGYRLRELSAEAGAFCGRVAIHIAWLRALSVVADVPEGSVPMRAGTLLLMAARYADETLPRYAQPGMQHHNHQIVVARATDAAEVLGMSRRLFYRVWWEACRARLCIADADTAEVESTVRDHVNRIQALVLTEGVASAAVELPDDDEQVDAFLPPML